LKVEIELLQRFDPRETSLPQPGLNAPLMPPLPFDPQRLGQEALIVQFVLRGLLTDCRQLTFQMLQL
jgi:hypothetical protein